MCGEPPGLPLEGSGFHPWQVRQGSPAGLRTRRHYERLLASLPAAASRTLKGVQCLMTAFVPAYRCGAAPDSHRIPSFHTASCEEAVPVALQSIAEDD